MQLKTDYLSNNENLYVINTRDFYSLTENKSYTPITGCVLEHIITTSNLTHCEKLYYLLADSQSLISKNKGESRSCGLPSEDWADRLGCSRSLVFTMQKNLVKKGYFIINKDFDEIGRNNRNLITPTLPTSVFNQLNEKYLDRVGDHTPYNPLSECKRAYLDRTKLFIKLNYNLLKIISSNKYTNPKQKIMWLGFYTRCYKNYMLQGKEEFNVSKYSYSEDSSFSFISSYRELADMNSCNTKHLSKSIRALEELGFIKTQNIYVRKRYSDNADCRVQERQDQSLWKITLSLPDECISELEKVKNRSNLKVKDIKAEVATIENTLDPKLIEDCLILGGIKFNLNLEQSSLLKSIIVDDNDDDCSGVINCNGNIDAISPLPHAAPCDKSYIDSVMEELNIETTWKVEDKLEKSFRVGDSKFLSDEPKNLSTSSSLEELDEKIEKNDGVKSDPHVAKSGLLLNKDFLLKIKDIKSNLGATPKILFNNFLKRFSKDEFDENVDSKKDDIAKDREFNIHSELIREKLKILPKDKADKARKFAYSLVSKGLAKGYAASLSKHELAKQIIHHAATWKPTKLGCVSREKEIDAALSVAWKKIISGTWQVPLELAKAKILQYEFNAYRRKYQESGVLSHEAKALESDVNNLLGGWCDLVGKITDGVNTPATLEDNMLSIRDVDVYSSINVPLKLGLEERVCQQRSYPSEDLALDGSFSSDFNDTGSHKLDYDCLEIEEGSNTLNINLLHIPDQQKYLKVIPSDNDDSMKLETINGKEYFVKLKELEMNDNGEFVMTLKSMENNLFLGQNSDNSVIKNLAINDLENQHGMLKQEQLLQQSFVKIDTVLSSVFKNLQHEVK